MTRPLLAPKSMARKMCVSGVKGHVSGVPPSSRLRGGATAGKQVADGEVLQVTEFLNGCRSVSRDGDQVMRAAGHAVAGEEIADGLGKIMFSKLDSIEATDDKHLLSK